MYIATLLDWQPENVVLSLLNADAASRQIMHKDASDAYAERLLPFEDKILLLYHPLPKVKLGHGYRRIFSGSSFTAAVEYARSGGYRLLDSVEHEPAANKYIKGRYHLTFINAFREVNVASLIRQHKIKNI